MAKKTTETVVKAAPGTLTINAAQNYLLHYALTHSPLEGLRVSDLELVEAAKKTFDRKAFEGTVVTVIAPEHLRLVRAAWDALPVGRLVRTPDLLEHCKGVTEMLKE